MSAPPADSIIRVFISSTFRDMNAERDALVMGVFPSVEAYCRKRGLTFVPVDLRWGITARQAQREQTVDICLREIDACRPCFIGMLAERYGWIPPGLDISVTEREMIYGALGQPTQETNALFLLRAPSLTDRLVGFTEGESAEDRRKLQSLKRRIRASGYPTVNGYRTIESFARHVEKWLRGVVDSSFPCDMTDDGMDDSRAQERFILKLARQSLDRPALEAQLDDYAGAANNERLLITGEPGSGKTTLLARWLMRRANDCRVFYHFYDASSRNLWQQVAARLVMELCGRRMDDIPKDDAALRQAVAAALRMATAGGEKLILVLDGIDRLKRDGRELAWLTEHTNPNIRLIISLSDTELLSLFQMREHRLLHVQPLQKREKRAVAASMMRMYGKTLDARLMESIADAPQTANARYLHILLNELRCFGQYEGVSARLGSYLRAQDSVALFRIVLRRMEELCGGNGRSFVRDVLGGLLLSTRGLTENELLSIAGGIPQAIWSPLHHALMDYISEADGRLHLSEPALREAAEAAYISSQSARNAIRARLIRYFAHCGDIVRAMEELPALYAQAERWSSLRALLSRGGYTPVGWKRDSYALRQSWRMVAQHTGCTCEEAADAIDADKLRGDELLAWSELLMYMNAPKAAERLLDSLINMRGTKRLYREQAMNLRGNLLLKRGQLRQARRQYEELLKCCERTGNLREKQRTLGNIGKLSFRLGDYADALDAFERAEKLCREISYPEGTQIALHGIGNVRFAMGEPELALDAYREQERLCLEHGDMDGLITSLGSQGAVCLKLNKTRRAGELFERQAEQCRRINHFEGLQAALGNMAVIRAEVSFEEALTLIGEKESICRRIQYLSGLQSALRNKAELLSRCGRHNEALAACEERAELLRHSGEPAPLCESLIMLGQAQLLVGQREASMQSLHTARALAMQNGFGQRLINIERLIKEALAHG